MVFPGKEIPQRLPGGTFSDWKIIKKVWRAAILTNQVWGPAACARFTRIAPRQSQILLLFRLVLIRSGLTCESSRVPASRRAYSHVCRPGLWQGRRSLHIHTSAALAQATVLHHAAALGRRLQRCGRQPSTGRASPAPLSHGSLKASAVCSPPGTPVQLFIETESAPWNCIPRRAAVCPGRFRAGGHPKMVWNYSAAAAVSPAMRPETMISTIALPPKRLPPKKPPVTSPAAYRPSMMVPSSRST